MTDYLLERSWTPGIVGREQKFSHAQVSGRAHVGSAFAETIVCALGQRDHAICRGLPRGVPALWIAFGNYFCRLQNFAEIGTVGLDVSRIP